MRFLSLLALLTIAVVTLVMLGTVFRAYYIGRRRRAAATFGAWLGSVAIYGVVLVGVSLASSEHVLPPGIEKRFCALDCDLAYSVAEVFRADRGVPGQDASFVRVRVRSDAQVARIWPSDFKAWLLAAGGMRVDPVTPPRPALLGDLGPGESQTIELQFEIPERTEGLRLAVAEGGWPSRIMIGDENSFLHRKTVFQLQEPLQAGAHSQIGR